MITFCIDCNKKLHIHANVAGNIRCRSCSKKGELHSGWLGENEDRYTIEFFNIREQILNRDHHECCICHKTSEQQIKEFQCELSIHHMDYNKKNCSDTNLISLCSSCHMKTNFNREEWIKYFKEDLICQKI